MKKVVANFFAYKSSLQHWCMAWIFGVMVCIAGLLISHAYYLKNVVAELAEVKEDYKVCTSVLRRVLHEKTKELSSVITPEQKKKIIYDVPGYYGWPREVPLTAIVSSDQETIPFKVVNRDNEYLITHSIEFAKHHHLEKAVASLVGAPVLEHTHEGVKKQKRPLIKKRGSSIAGASCRVRSLRMQPTVKETDFAFALPIDKSEFYISSPFGPRKIKGRPWKFHYGIDMAAVRGVPVKAPASGIVLESGFHNGMGNYIVIAHNRKYKTRYFHLHRRRVKVGQKVSRGEHIADVGSTGFVARRKGRDPSHLHFEVCAFGRHIDPMSVLPL